MLKFQAVAEKMAKNFRGLLFLPHPVDDTVYVTNFIKIDADFCLLLQNVRRGATFFWTQCTSAEVKVNS